MAVFNEPSQWNTSLVVNGDTNVIPQSTPAGSGALSFDDGFPQITQIPLGAGGIAPDRKDFNAVMKLLGDAVFFMQNGGFWSYNPLFDYAVGRVVLYTDGNLYKCIQANGASSTVVAPDSVSPLGNDYWVQVATLADFANFANIDLSNVTSPVQAFKDMSIEWVMPDYSAGVSLAEQTTNEQNFTISENGYLAYIFYSSAGGNGYIKINDISILTGAPYNVTSGNTFTGIIPVNKNDIVKYKTYSTGYDSYCRLDFYPCKGV